MLEEEFATLAATERVEDLWSDVSVAENEEKIGVKSIAEGPPYNPASISDPRLLIYHSFQPGLYFAEVRINPTEPGTLYLKAFEITKGTRLSSESI